VTFEHVHSCSPGAKCGRWRSGPALQAWSEGKGKKNLQISNHAS
jgi:hypothetical protein